MLIAVGDCDMLIRVDRRVSRLCLAGGLLVEALAGVLVLVGLLFKSNELLAAGGGSLCAGGLVPFRAWFVRQERIALLTEIRTSLAQNRTLTEATEVLLRKVLGG